MRINRLRSVLCLPLLALAFCCAGWAQTTLGPYSGGTGCNTGPSGIGAVIYSDGTKLCPALAGSTLSAGGGFLNETQATLSAPAAPTLTVSATGGSITQVSGTTVFVIITLVNPFGETVGSTETSIAVSTGNGCTAAATTCSVNVPQPTLSGNATAYTVYSSISATNELQQTASGACVSITGTCVVGTVGTGVIPPQINMASNGTTVAPSWKASTGTGKAVLDTMGIFNADTATEASDDGTIYVGNGITKWKGADIGAQINNAYTVGCQSMGCKIHIVQATYPAWSTPISFTTANKPVILDCDPNTTLTATFTSGNAITLDTGINHKVPTGIVGCTFYSSGIGNGSTLNGIHFPNTNGAENFLLRDMKIGSGDATPYCVTTAASLTTNVVTLTCSNNPITAGFVTSQTIRVGGFTGADTFFNGTFFTTGVTSTTITFALTHANGSATSLGVAIAPSFTTAVNIVDAAALVIFGDIQKAYIGGNITGINASFTAGHSMENLRVSNSVIYANDTGMNLGGAQDAQLYGNSFDDNVTAGINCTAGQVSGGGNHFENAKLGLTNYILDGCFMKLDGGEILDDATTGTTPQMITVNGSPGDLVMDGTFVQTAGRTVTNVMTVSGSADVGVRFFRSGANLGGDYTTSGSGLIQDFNWQTSGFQVDKTGILVTNSKICAGGTCAAASPASSITAASGSTAGQYNIGTDGNMAFFRSGSSLLAIIPTNGVWQFSGSGLTAEPSVAGGTTLGSAALPFLSLSLGTVAPAFTVGTAGFWCATEGTAPTNVASTAALYPDSTTHELEAKTNGASTAGMMVRIQPSPIVQTAKTAAITTATLCASAAGACNTAGQYRVSWNFWGSGTACSSVTAGSVTFLLTWTDENAVAHSAVVMPMLNQTGATSVVQGNSFTFATALANESASGDVTISTNGSVIQYATGYTACTTGTGTYNLRASVMRIQ